MLTKSISLSALLLLAACGGGGSKNHSTTGPTSPSPKAQAAAVVQESCIGCHRQPTPRNHEVGLADLDAVAANAKLVTPGCPDKSELVEVLKEGKMPPRGALPADKVQVVSDWVKSLDPDATCN